jgi:hypothetical protein
MDQVVYDMSSQSEAEPNIFVKKDWVSILDNQNSVYSSNQCVIDTSQLSNSNKWISYRESYLTIPMLLSLTQSANSANFLASLTAKSADYSISLKNWYGSIIHSISVDLGGTTIVQQTPFQSLWNNFKLLTTLSYQDLLTIGPSIGFYPDNSSSWTYFPTANAGGLGVSNNNNAFVAPVVNTTANSHESFNNGFYQRQRAWNFNVAGLSAPTAPAFSSLVTQGNLQLIYKSSILQPVIPGAAGARGLWQAQIVATVFLRHLHEFFNKIPLSKGVFMKITMNLNNTTTNVTVVQGAGAAATSLTQSSANSSFPLGGVCPILFASGNTGNGMANLITSGETVSLFASLYVGSKCYETNAVAAGGAASGYVNNVTLTAPSYTFNPVYEQAYLSSPVKKIDYADIYQYQVLNILKNANFNNLITNGIAGIKSVLVIPYHSAVTAVNGGISPLQSCFDTAGSTTSPLTYLSNFNVVISGQNAIYNSQRYTYEQFLNQLNGQNGVNGGQVDGMSSGLISQLDFESMYNFYYINVERCLPSEKGVSKSVNIIGQNMSEVAIDLYVFIEYGVSISINVYTGSRV